MKRKKSTTKRKKEDFDQSATWIWLLTIASILFLIIGVVMVTVNTKYLPGIRYLLTAILFLTAIKKIKNKKIIISDCKNDLKPMFFLGFIFSVLGLSNLYVLWPIGIIFFAFAVFHKNKKLIK